MGYLGRLRLTESEALNNESITLALPLPLVFFRTLLGIWE